jgi:hypothetical protein
MRDAWGAGYWATWLPTARRQLGEIGTRGEDQQFVAISTLAEQDIASATTSAGSKDTLSWHSSGDVKVAFRANGSTPEIAQALANAGVDARVEFRRSEGIFVAYQGLSETRLSDQPRLAAELVKLYWKGKWDKDWYVVSHLVVTESATILMAGNGAAFADLAADGSVGTGPATLADLSAKVRVARSHGLGLEHVGDGVTPLFQVLRLSRKFLGGIEAKYGAAGHRTGPDRPADLPGSLVKEAHDDHEFVLETVTEPPIDDED